MMCQGGPTVKCSKHQVRAACRPIMMPVAQSSLGLNGAARDSASTAVAGFVDN